MPDWANLYQIMKLTIITINRNNASGLEKTMESVLSQTCMEYEYVLVDGASTDASVEVIKRFANSFGGRLKWISEPDKGIYNAMNKGIRLAGGEYVQFLNSGDRLAGKNAQGPLLCRKAHYIERNVSWKHESFSCLYQAGLV